MKKLFLILLATLFLSLHSCEKNDKVDVPQWIQERIGEIEDNPAYYGATIHRYSWDNIYIYEFYRPVSSCLYCECYLESGDQVNWQVYDIEDYLADRTDKVLIWCYDD
jgi:hypothetical protein